MEVSHLVQKPMKDKPEHLISNDHARDSVRKTLTLLKP